MLTEDKYETLEKIGRGGSGTVYKAWDKHLSCFVAVKEYRRKNTISRKEALML